MAVTTRDYSITRASPDNIINALNRAFADLGWHDVEAPGYLLTFSSLGGSTVQAEANKRYLVSPTVTTGSGANAVFDILRNQLGTISTITLVTGGKNYRVTGRTYASSSGNVVNVLDTANISPGMVMTKIAGTGTVNTNTVVASVINATAIYVDQIPTLALSGPATVQFADVITIDYSSIGGHSFTYNGAANNGASNLTVAFANTANIDPGMRVYGTNIANLTYVTSMFANNVYLSKPTLGIVNNDITFTDDISIVCGTIANFNGITGNTSGNNITNVPTNANLYVGAKVGIQSGSANIDMSGGDVYVAAIAGTGPYTVYLRNTENTFKGFDANTTITFKATTGNTSDWFSSDIYSAPLTASWGILKSVNASDKKLGTSFWQFLAATTATTHQPVGGTGPYLYIRAFPGFNPSSFSSQGVAAYDYYSSALATSTAVYGVALRLASTPLVPLTLRVRQSAIDPNFATFSFFEGNNNRNNFCISRYNTSTQPWDLNDVFLGAPIEFFASPAYNTNEAYLNFRTRMTALPKRMAEAGYGNYYQLEATTIIYTTNIFRSQSGNRSIVMAAAQADYLYVNLYTRVTGDIQNDVTNQAVFKNVPINPAWAPVPYYLPSDFIIAELPYANPNLGDTITVSPSEVYTVIQFATNQTTFTSVVLAARTT